MENIKNKQMIVYKVTLFCWNKNGGVNTNWEYVTLLAGDSRQALDQAENLIKQKKAIDRKGLFVGEIEMVTILD